MFRGMRRPRLRSGSASSFARCTRSATVVANSKLVAEALREHFGLGRERVTVLYPGFESRRYSPQRSAQLRAAARRALGVAAARTARRFRDLGRFREARPRSFPRLLRRVLPLRGPTRGFSSSAPGACRTRRVRMRSCARVSCSYRAKCRDPEPWFAALDLFLYAARFEEFGMVVAEAQAMGVPVLTSRRVGASECLPDVYAPWLLDGPEPSVMAERAVELLADAGLRAAACRGCRGIGHGIRRPRLRRGNAPPSRRSEPAAQVDRQPRKIVEVVGSAALRIAR